LLDKKNGRKQQNQVTTTTRLATHELTRPSPRNLILTTTVAITTITIFFLRCFLLCSQVLVHLRSKSWETRSAASQAIEAIAKNVPHWDPPIPPPGTDESAILADNLTDEGRLAFESFNIEAAVKNGSPLLASSGVEYDVDFGSMDPKERIALQKKLLKQSLGQGAEFMKCELYC
jgi:hypothetical protein